jgi:hypothetical protein
MARRDTANFASHSLLVGPPTDVFNDRNLNGQHRTNYRRARDEFVLERFPGFPLLPPTSSMWHLPFPHDFVY